METDPETAVWTAVLLLVAAVLLVAIVRTMNADRLERSYRRSMNSAGVADPPTPERAVFVAQVFWALFWISFVVACAGMGAVILVVGG